MKNILKNKFKYLGLLKFYINRYRDIKLFYEFFIDLVIVILKIKE